MASAWAVSTDIWQLDTCVRYILEFGVSYWGDLSIGTEALELTFILIPFLSHTFAVSWEVYSISQYVRRNWTDLSSVLRCVYVRNHNGYQQLYT